MRKCEIAVGVVDLLIVVFGILEPYIANATATIAADGPTSIYVSPSPISSTLMFVTALAGMLLLIPPRWKVIAISSLLGGLSHALIMSYWSIRAIDNPYSPDWDAESFITFVCILLFSMANISLLLQRRKMAGHRQQGAD